MFGFAPLTSVPLSSLPVATGQAATGFITGGFGMPLAGYNRTQEATGFNPTQFGTPTFGVSVQATGIPPGTLFGAPPKFGPTILQIVGNGANGGTSFPETSPYYRAVTRNGAIATSTAQSRYGTGSIEMTGASTANNLSMGASALNNLGGGGPFTIEAQVYLNAYNASGGRLLSVTGGTTGYSSLSTGVQWSLEVNASGIGFNWILFGVRSPEGGSSSYWPRSMAGAVSLSAWKHIAVTFDGTTMRLFVEGALVASSANSMELKATAGTLQVGAMYGEASGATNAANAYIQQIRIRRDCLYTAAFTPPAAGLPSWVGEVLPGGGIAPTTQIPNPRVRLGLPATTVGAVTQFGTAFGQNLQRPTGFQPTAVGDPRIFPYSPPPINSTQFGTARLFPYHVAPGINGTQFGALAGWQHWNAQPLGAPGPTSRVSMAYFRFDQTRVATGASTTHIGTAQGHRVLTVPAGRTCQAFGICATAFGSAHYVYAQTAQTTGASTTGFGAPRAVFVQLTTGWVGTSVPTPAAAIATYAHGSRMPAYGAAILRITLPATGSLRTQWFGSASSERSNTYKTYGINRAGRFGQPVGGSWHNHPATGFALAVLGAPALKQGHRATGLPPNGHLGGPLLKRITQC